jgi:hypothetical protein
VCWSTLQGEWLPKRKAYIDMTASDNNLNIKTKER